MPRQTSLLYTDRLPSRPLSVDLAPLALEGWIDPKVPEWCCAAARRLNRADPSLPPGEKLLPNGMIGEHVGEWILGLGPQVALQLQLIGMPGRRPWRRVVIERVGPDRQELAAQVNTHMEDFDTLVGLHAPGDTYRRSLRRPRAFWETGWRLRSRVGFLERSSGVGAPLLPFWDPGLNKGFGSLIALLAMVKEPTMLTITVRALAQETQHALLERWATDSGRWQHADFNAPDVWASAPWDMERIRQSATWIGLCRAQPAACRVALLGMGEISPLLHHSVRKMVTGLEPHEVEWQPLSPDQVGLMGEGAWSTARCPVVSPVEGVVARGLDEWVPWGVVEDVLGLVGRGGI